MLGIAWCSTGLTSAFFKNNYPLPASALSDPICDLTNHIATMRERPHSQVNHRTPHRAVGTVACENSSGLDGKQDCANGLCLSRAHGDWAGMGQQGKGSKWAKQVISDRATKKIKNYC